ncbi:hypothetical protein HDV00_009503 [Rhizophlyctis rosea]|nr:hypothetical protein HDV00_009503 [Rhizophlyctis rosea]
MSRPHSSLSSSFNNLAMDSPSPPPQQRDASSPLHYRSQRSLRPLSRSTTDLLSFGQPPTAATSRSASPDVATILERVDRQLQNKFARAEDNLKQSGDGLVRAKLAVKSGSVAHLAEGGGGMGSRMDLSEGGGSGGGGMRGSRMDLAGGGGNGGSRMEKDSSHGYGSRNDLSTLSGNPRSATRSRTDLTSLDSNDKGRLTKAKSQASLSTTNLRRDASQSSSTLLPEIDPKYKKGAKGGGELVRAGSVQSVEDKGAAAIAAAEAAIREGEERRKRLQNSLMGIHTEETSLTASTSNLVTSRLADPNYFPPAYRNKYEAIQRHQDRVIAEAVAASSGGSGGVREPLSKKAEEVVKRLTDPSNSTAAQKAKSRSTDRIDYTGHPTGYRPPDEANKAALRSKPKIEFFTDFAGPDSSSGSAVTSTRSSMVNLASGTGSHRASISKS